MPRESLQTLYEHELTDLYSAETQIIEALPKLIKAATNPALKAALTEHLAITETQLGRLDQIFEALGKKPESEKCKGMEGLIKEGDKAIEEHKDSDVLDAAIIGATQRVEHYEMAGYGCARTYAAMLGLTKQSEILQTTLNEEGEADHRLTDLAEECVNLEAMKV
ncbi:MAG: ferritin-like domain-containing protein [Gemmatimonadaceae bacterium]|nr:ferritin-like domain-containing protein [Gemmatimonadaceae bacterium]